MSSTWQGEKSSFDCEIIQDAFLICFENESSSNMWYKKQQKPFFSYT